MGVRTCPYEREERERGKEREKSLSLSLEIILQFNRFALRFFLKVCKALRGLSQISATIEV